MAPIGIVTMLFADARRVWVGRGSCGDLHISRMRLPRLRSHVSSIGWDKFRLLIPTTVLSAIAFTLLMIAANQRWPSWTLFVNRAGRRIDAQHFRHGQGALGRAVSRSARAQHRICIRVRCRRAGLHCGGCRCLVALSVSLFAEAESSPLPFCYAWERRRSCSSDQPNPSLRQHGSTSGSLQQSCCDRFSCSPWRWCSSAPSSQPQR